MFHIHKRNESSYCRRLWKRIYKGPSISRISPFMRFLNKNRVNYGFRRDNKWRMLGTFIHREDIYKLAEQLLLLWWDSHLQWSSCSFGTILPIWFHAVLIYVCLQLAMVLILRVVTSMKTNKQIENICKEHVPNVLELSGKIPWSM